MKEITLKIMKTEWLLKTRLVVIAFAILISILKIADIISFNIAMTILCPIVIFTGFCCHKIRTITKTN